jgi:hypothetical protein
MSVELDPIVISNTFGVWKDRTNEIINNLETVIQVGSDADTNANGEIIIKGDITSTANVIVDTIEPYTASGEIHIDAPIRTGEEVTIVNDSDGASKITMHDGDGITWKIHTNSDHDVLDIIRGDRVFRIAQDPTQNEGYITGSNLVIDSTLMPSTDSIDEGINNLYYTDARVRAAVDVANGSSITYNANTGIFDFVMPDIPDYYVKSGKGLFKEAGTGANSGDWYFGINYDNSTIKVNTSGNIYVPDAAIRAAISSGTGVSISNGKISIGQAVATNSGVTFGSVVTGGDITVKNNTDDVIKLKASDGSITANGDITAFGDASDKRLKENLKPIDNALEKVSQVSGYTFNYIDDDRSMTGVVAQEIETVLPEVVYDTEKDGETYKAVRYGNIVGLLIEAIKELKAEVEELKQNK